MAKQKKIMKDCQVHFLGSGSGGNATLIRAGATRILVDCGFSARQIGRRLEAIGESLDRLNAILITHEHRDHVAGLAILARRSHLTVYFTRGTARKTPFDAKAACNRVHIRPGDTFLVGPVQVESFPTSHDAADPVGFVFGLPDGTRLGMATDLGTTGPAVIRALEGCHLLAVEANHDPEMLQNGPYPWYLKKRIASNKGHLSNKAAADLLRQVASDGLRGVFAIHRSETNNRPELVRRVLLAELSRLSQPVKLGIVDQQQPHSFPAQEQLELI